MPKQVFILEEILKDPIGYFNLTSKLPFGSAPLFWLGITLAIIISPPHQDKNYLKEKVKEDEKESTDHRFSLILTKNLGLSCALRASLLILETIGSKNKPKEWILLHEMTANLLEVILLFILQKDITRSLIKTQEPGFLMLASAETTDWIKLLIAFTLPYMLLRGIKSEFFFPWEQMKDSCILIGLGIPVALACLKGLRHLTSKKQQAVEFKVTSASRIFNPKPPYQIDPQLQEFFQVFGELIACADKCFQALEQIKPCEPKKAKHHLLEVNTNLRNAYHEITSVLGQLRQRGNHFPSMELKFHVQEGLPVKKWKNTRREWKRWVILNEISAPGGLTIPVEKMKKSSKNLKEKVTCLSRLQKQLLSAKPVEQPTHSHYSFH